MADKRKPKQKPDHEDFEDNSMANVDQAEGKRRKEDGQQDPKAKANPKGGISGNPGHGLSTDEPAEGSRENVEESLRRQEGGE